MDEKVIREVTEPEPRELAPQEEHLEVPRELTPQEKHLAVIRAQVEEAKNPASYETYEYQTAEADEHIHLFAARRMGKKHVRENIPCQDYCLVRSLPGCTVLADADGVSSCERSDVGSRLACEAVVHTVEMAATGCENEEQLVNRIQSVSFREKLVSLWIRMVMAHIDVVNGTGSGNAPGNPTAPVDRMKEFNKYGSTLMYAVLTENWILVGNLGDGQILVFNDSCGVKLRVHAPKDSSRVRCLVNERCVREDFLVAKYPRKEFNGVLLTTDGIYESLDKNTHFYRYAMQLKERFLAARPFEPYQPFCYQEPGQPNKDFSVMRTQDDCSIAMAIDDRRNICEEPQIENSIAAHAQAAMLKRWSPDCKAYVMKRGEVFADLLVTDSLANVPADALAGLKWAIPDKPLLTWTEGDQTFRMYPEGGDQTIEFLHATGALRVDRHNPEKSEKMILNVLYLVTALSKELWERGYELVPEASFLISFDGKELHVKREAIRRRDEALREREEAICRRSVDLPVRGEAIGRGDADEKDKRVLPESLNRCFAHIVGVMESRDRIRPILHSGYVDRGMKLLIGTSGWEEELAQVICEKKELRLKNTGRYSWRMRNDGVVIEPGSSVGLGDGFTFTVESPNPNGIPEEYQYVPREKL